MIVMVLISVFGVAEAGPYQMLQPARTMTANTTEMGGGIGYNAAASSIDQGTVMISGWGRYGVTDRVEVSGGAYIPWINDVGLHGNARFGLIGNPANDGLHLSTGIGVGTQLRALSALSFTVPATIGVRAGAVDVFAGPSISAMPLGDAGTYVAWNAEAGVGIDANGIPVYIAGTYGQVLGFDVVGINVGFGYNLGI